MAVVPWKGDRCILCLRQAPFGAEPHNQRLTEEHIIPKRIGGILTCRFLCHGCNVCLGDRIDAQVQNDPWVKIAFASVTGLPVELANIFYEGQKFDLKGSGPDATGTYKKERLQTDGAKLPDGSLLIDTLEAPKVIAGILRKEGADDGQIQSIIERFNDAPGESLIELSAGASAIKWSTNTIRPSIYGRSASPLIAIKMAYEFLALLLGSSVYDPGLDPIRDVLKSSQLNDSVTVDRGFVEPYAEWHWLANLPRELCTIRVGLFGGVVSEVVFPILASFAPNLLYRHNLKTGEEFVQQIETGSADR